MTAKTEAQRRMAWRNRVRERGGAVLTLRIRANALRRLQDLATAHNCTKQDVVEGLLLGNVEPAHPLRLSQVEVECAKALGLRL